MMKHIRRRYFVVFAVILFIVAVALWGHYALFSRFLKSETSEVVYIDNNDNLDSVCAKLRPVAQTHSLAMMRRIIDYRDDHIRTGFYTISPNATVLDVVRQLRNGLQTPVKLTVGEVRTRERLASQIASQLMVDSAELCRMFCDTLICRKLGYDSCTVMAMFVPNTYEVYWNISTDNLLERLKREHDAFWDSNGRREKAEALGLTPDEVATLASIVDEETANAAEKPVIAGLYLNRLWRGMLLQADPTVKFAVGDFTLRRILNRHLEVESPYNTYRHEGLPPGPIRVASVQGINAVLNATNHDYLYMCAKEDFSGTHNFARTLREHQQNAARYARALNERGIMK